MSVLDRPALAVIGTPRPAPRTWTGPLATFATTAGALECCRSTWQTNPRAAHRVLGALLEAGDDDACLVVLAALAPGLRAAASKLAQRWPIDEDEADAEVAAAAWAAIRDAAGTRLAWPARTLVDVAYGQARNRIRREARRDARGVVLEETSAVRATNSPSSRIEARSILDGWARTARLSQAAVELIWSTRVEGADLSAAGAAAGQRPAAARAMRSRAERALRQTT